MKKALFPGLFLLMAVVLHAQKPELVLPAIHSKPIQGASCSRNGKFLVSTAGGDIKIWELSSGKLIRTLQCLEDIFYSRVTMSSDAKWLVAATDYGWNEATQANAPLLFVLDPVTGKKMKSFGKFKETMLISYLELSTDARYLLTGVYEQSADKVLSYVFDLKTGAELRVFPGRGRLDDTGEMVLLTQQDTLSLAGIASGKIDPIAQEPHVVSKKAGNKVIIVTNEGHIKQWDLQTKTFTSDLVIKLDSACQEALKVRNVFSQISDDGLRFVMMTDGYARDTQYQYRFQVFDTRTAKKLADHVRSNKLTYFSLYVYSPDLEFFVTWPYEDVASTGSLIRAYSTTNSKQQHSMGLDVLQQTTHDNFFKPEIQFFNQGKVIIINREMNAWEMPSSVFYSETGLMQELGDPDSVASFIAKNALVKDGRWTAECTDGLSYQVKNAQSKKTIATLLLADGEEHTWAVTTPEGLFDASPDMMQSLHYVSGIEIIGLEQLKERYYEPGLLAKLFGYSQESLRPVAALNAVDLYPEMSARISDDQLKLQVALKPRNGGIGKLSIFVNGKEVQEDANPGRAQSVEINLPDFAAYYLPSQANTIALRVYNESGWLKSQALELAYQPPASARGSGNGSTAPLVNKKPSLYALVIGTANYAGTQLDLRFSDHDATVFSQALRAVAPKLFDDRVNITLLNTDDNDKSRQGVSSKASIKEAFANIAAKAQAQDVLIIYFSGHGVNYGAAESGQFYYLTKDIASENLSDPEIRENYTVSSSELTTWITAIAALKQVLILDACNAGKIVQDITLGRRDLSSSQIRALDRMKDRTGMFILTGAAADKVSYEAGQYGQGLLTYSLLQGMSGLALTEDKRVDVMTLFQYSRDVVPELAKGIGGIQTPILAFPNNGASFDIGIVDAQVKIPLAQVKPVFIRNVFQDEDTFDDAIGLTKALEAHLQSLTVKGSQAEIIFVDVQEYENAYSMKGRYKVNGDAVELRARLFKGKTSVGEEFKVSGNKGNLADMAAAILDKAMALIRK